MGRLVDLTGQKFGRLTVIKRAENVKKKTMWRCVCECGNEKIVEARSLKIGETRSCGCLHRDTIKITSATHGLSNTPLYRVYRHIKSRCYNKNDKSYKDYGGRGIGICEEWLEDFAKFYQWSLENGYQKGLEIDRIDNDKDYSPDNCRWTNRTVQANNRRTNRHLTCRGKTLTVAEWSRISGVSQSLIWTRVYKLGWSVEDAIFSLPKSFSQTNDKALNIKAFRK